MPVYEFYCKKCDTIFSFFSRKVDTEKVPDCPQCKDEKLKRKVSLFNSPSGKKDENEDGLPDIDESKLMRAMAMLEREAGNIREDDPVQAANLMRKLTEAAGLNLGGGLEEALARMERGEDLETIEAEMGDRFNEDDLFAAASSTSRTRKHKPKVDETLYEL